jgi:chaperonin GroEL (HSP60 family)
MAHKQILFRSAAREKILRGTTQLADAVRVTLGPRSKSVLIEKKWGAPIVCNDGVTIVRIALENAVSVASILLLTEATMTEIPEDKKERGAEPEMAM